MDGEGGWGMLVGDAGGGGGHSITINVPLFKKLRDIIFFCGTTTL
jgi:hypothetical protein